MVESRINFFEALKKLGFTPKKTSSSKGGEYHSPCPWCGGNDRFMFWLGQDKYYCRQCGKSGSLDYFLWQWFQLPYKNRPYTEQPIFIKSQKKLESNQNVKQWVYVATEFIERCSANESSLFFELLRERGINQETARKFKLGYNPSSFFCSSLKWGISSEKKMFIPQGLVTPVFAENQVVRIKIRKDGEVQGAKYIEVKGSSQTDAIYGSSQALHQFPVVIVESELDAILLHQEVGDVCSFVALGGASKRLSDELMAKLMQNPEVLLSLDNDTPGKKASLWWLKKLPLSKVWFTPHSKSPGDASQKGLKLRDWVLTGLSIKKMKNKQRS